MKTKLVLVLAAMMFVVSIVPASAWEERLAECAALGIPPENCPDDDSVLVPPVVIEPPKNSTSNETVETPSQTVKKNKRTSGGSSKHWMWIKVSEKKSSFEPNSEKYQMICETHYYRLIEETNNPKMRWYKDFHDRTRTSCRSI